MHDIEPHFHWRERYRAEDDDASPFHGRVYSEFGYSNRVYNYLIHPQWDEFGAETLYLKILFVDYDDQYAIIELIGEWNDAVHNDSMHLKTRSDRPTDRPGHHEVHPHSGGRPELPRLRRGLLRRMVRRGQ